MAIANLPDADFLVGFVLGQPGHFHRGISHTAVAALAFGALAGAFCRWRFRDRWLRASLMFATVYASHLLLDAFTIDERGPAGVQFLWPFTDAHLIAPFTLFTEIIIDGSSRLGFLGSVLAWPTVVVLARETLIALVLIAAVHAFGPWLRAARERGLAIGLRDDGEEDLA